MTGANTRSGSFVLLVAAIAASPNTAAAAACDTPAADFDGASPQVQAWGSAVARVSAEPEGSAASRK